MSFTESNVIRLARAARCPRCHLTKTQGNALCRSCRAKLPANMRAALEKVAAKDPWTVGRALRQAANYFDVHFRSVLDFGGARRR